MQKSELASFSFRITSVKCGWLFAEIDISDWHTDLSNSYLGGLELPKALIRACNGFLSGNTKSEWLCWHEESQGQLWHMHYASEQLRLEVYHIGCSFGLPVCGDSLAEKVRNSVPILTADLDLFLFAQTVCDAFKEYRYGDAFEQWQNSAFTDSFPKEEFQALRKALRNGSNL